MCSTSSLRPLLVLMLILNVLDACAPIVTTPAASGSASQSVTVVFTTVAATAGDDDVTAIESVGDFKKLTSSAAAEKSGNKVTYKLTGDCTKIRDAANLVKTQQTAKISDAQVTCN